VKLFCILLYETLRFRVEKRGFRDKIKERDKKTRAGLLPPNYHMGIIKVSLKSIQNEIRVKKRGFRNKPRRKGKYRVKSRKKRSVIPMAYEESGYKK